MRIRRSLNVERSQIPLNDELISVSAIHRRRAYSVVDRVADNPDQLLQALREAPKDFAAHRFAQRTRSLRLQSARVNREWNSRAGLPSTSAVENGGLSLPRTAQTDHSGIAS